MLGRADPELTEEGHRQAKLLANALRGEPVSVILTSPLLRARQTAEPIGEACGVPVEVDDRLIEIDWGAWEGRATGSLATAEVNHMKAEDGTAPEGESLDSLAGRVESFCTEQLDQDGLVVAVSHVSPIKAAAAWAMGVDGAVAWRMYLGLASITRVGRGKANPVLLSFNETGHLHVAEERNR